MHLAVQDWHPFNSPPFTRRLVSAAKSPPWRTQIRSGPERLVASTSCPQYLRERSWPRHVSTYAQGHVWTAPGCQGKLARCSGGRCSHVFGLLMRLTWPLAIMPSADQVPVSFSHCAMLWPHTGRLHSRLPRQPHWNRGDRRSRAWRESLPPRLFGSDGEGIRSRRYKECPSP